MGSVLCVQAGVVGDVVCLWYTWGYATASSKVISPMSHTPDDMDIGLIYLNDCEPNLCNNKIWLMCTDLNKSAFGTRMLRF